MCLVDFNFSYLYIVYQKYIPTPTYFTHQGRTERLVPQVRRWACCARAAYHGVSLSFLAEFVNGTHYGRIKGRVKSKVTRNEISKNKRDVEEEEEKDAKEEDVEDPKLRRVEEDEFDDDEDMCAQTNSIFAEFRANSRYHCKKHAALFTTDENTRCQ